MSNKYLMAIPGKLFFFITLKVIFEGPKKMSNLAVLLRFANFRKTV